MVAYIGTGLLGSGFVKAMLKKGIQVQVWNRTESKAKALEADGAKAFKEVNEVVKGANRIHLTLSDDAAVDEILERASAGFEPGVIILDHTTTTASGAIKRTQQWKERGFTYIHAPVFMGPQNALDGTGNMMVSGDQDAIKTVEQELSAMTGKLINLGDTPGKAAGIKLLGNLFLITLTGGITDTLTLAKSVGISADEVVSFFEMWNPGVQVPGRMKRMLTGEFDKPSWELKMARKDARMMMEEAAHGDLPLTVIPAIAKEMDRWIEKGNGEKDWSVIGKDAVS